MINTHHTSRVIISNLNFTSDQLMEHIGIFRSDSHVGDYKKWVIIHLVIIHEWLLKFGLPAVMSACHSSKSWSPANFNKRGMSKKLLAGVWMAKVLSPADRQTQVISDKLKCSLFRSFIPNMDKVPNSTSPRWVPVCSSSKEQFSQRCCPLEFWIEKEKITFKSSF